MKPITTIFIPTKNAGAEFHKTLNQISIQKQKDFEVIIVDSGSTDNTLKIAEQFKEKFPLKIYKIKPEEFSHGKTRNLALKYAGSNSRFIVFLTQDAIPLNNQWLSSLIENFKNPNIAGVFSKQIPKKNARETEKFFYNYYFSNEKQIHPSKNDSLLKIMFFSNVSSAIRKNILQKHPFNKTLIMTEDQEWAKRIIQKGYKKVYEPESIVIHSHNYSLKQTFQRYFDSAVSLHEILKGDFDKYVSSARKYPSVELELCRKNPFLMPYILSKNLIKFIAIKLGENEKRIPIFIKKRFSMHKDYWRRIENEKAC